MKRVINTSLKFFLLTLLIVISSCELNDDESFPGPDYPDPQVSFDGPSDLSLGVGQFLIIPGISYSAGVSLSSFVISESGNELFRRSFNTDAGTFSEGIFQLRIPEEWFDTSREILLSATDINGRVGTTSLNLTVVNIFPQYEFTPTSVNGEEFIFITGNINFDETLSSDNRYVISGEVTVSQQITLTIEPGTTIYGENEEARLEINQLGQIDAQGTLDDPIVFTSFNGAPGQSGEAEAGDWSGIGINGNNDNSGVMRYVRIEYPGSNDDAFQLTNVGAETVIEFIQIFRSPDNAFRINEGTVNLRYLIATDCEDSGMRVDDGWIGAGQFWVVNTTFNDNAIEGRDMADLLVSNVTITGVGFNEPGEASEGGGFRIRNNATARMYNCLITGVDRSLRFSDGSEQGVAQEVSFLANSISFGNDEDDGTGFHSSADFFNPTDNDYIPEFNNSVDPITIVNGYVGVGTENSRAAGALSPFFEDVNYVGAVPADNDWTLGWVLNIDGSLRE